MSEVSGMNILRQPTPRVKQHLGNAAPSSMRHSFSSVFATRFTLWTSTSALRQWIRWLYTQWFSEWTQINGTTNFTMPELIDHALSKHYCDGIAENIAQKRDLDYYSFFRGSLLNQHNWRERNWPIHFLRKKIQLPMVLWQWFAASGWEFLSREMNLRSSTKTVNFDINTGTRRTLPLM